MCPRVLYLPGDLKNTVIKASIIWFFLNWQFGVKYIRGGNDPLDHPVLFMQMQNCSHRRCFIALFKLTLNVLIDDISTDPLGSLLHHPVALLVMQHSLWSHVFLLYLLLLPNDSPSSMELLHSSSCHTSQSPFMLLYVLQFLFFPHSAVLHPLIMSDSFPHKIINSWDL